MKKRRKTKRRAGPTVWLAIAIVIVNVFTLCVIGDDHPQLHRTREDVLHRIISRQPSNERKLVRQPSGVQKAGKAYVPELAGAEAAVRLRTAQASTHLRGAGADEAPEVYKKLADVLAHHGSTVKIIHTLRPLIVCMAGGDEFDPYKD